MLQNEYILGIDIGGTSVKIGAIYQGRVVESESIRNSFKGNFESLIPAILPICNKLISSYSIKKMGIGCPGDFNGDILIKAINLGWQNINVIECFKKEFSNMEIMVANDGNAAYLAEKTYGDLKNVVNGIMLTIGKGIGGKIIANGSLLKGQFDMGSRIGHIIIKSDGRRCNCGQKGCFESYASISGLIKTVKEYNLRPYPEKLKIDVDHLSGFKIVNYLKAESKIVLDAVNKWHKDLADGILSLCNIVDPSIIVIAGGVTETNILNVDLLIEKIHKKGYKNVIIKKSTLKGNTGIIGAASLFINK